VLAAITNMILSTNEDVKLSDSVTLSLDKDDVLKYIDSGYIIYGIEEPELIDAGSSVLYDAGKIILKYNKEKEINKNG
jgi:hypothetical protein